MRPQLLTLSHSFIIYYYTNQKHKKGSKYDSRAVDDSGDRKRASKDNSSSDESNSGSSSDDENVQRSVITGKKIRMSRDLTVEDKLLEIERAAKRHYMNSQY